jgi:hypothetical protein
VKCLIYRSEFRRIIRAKRTTQVVSPETGRERSARWLLEKRMMLLAGIGAIAAAALLYAWAYAQHHRPGAPTWAKGQFFASTISLVVVLLAPLGVGFIIAGFPSAGLLAYAALLALPVVLRAVIPMLLRPMRQTVSADLIPMPTGPTRPAAPALTRRAAA